MKMKKTGFTLIELLVVIAIIGILSSVVLASLNSAREKSRDAKRVSDIKQIQLALEMYFDDQTPNAYPTGGAGDAIDVLETGGYLPQEPVDPASGASYGYVGVDDGDGNCTSYHLWATLEGPAEGDGVLASDDDFNSVASECAGTGLNDSTAAGQVYDVTP